LKVYLDNAATTPLAEEVIGEISSVMRSHFGNPSSIHQQGRDSRALVEMSRKKIATFIGAQSSEIVFTSGGTEADNLAIHAAIHDLKVQHIISSAIEHSAVYNTLRKSHVDVHWVKTNKYGEVDINHLRELLEKLEGKVLVSLMHVNNEIGTMLPLSEVGLLCKEFGAFFHSDTVQSIGHIPINVKELNIDFITCSAHKIHGLKGAGFLYVNKRNKIGAQIVGGGQERDIRGGTENVVGIVSMAKALSLCNISEEAKHAQSLKDKLYHGLKAIYHDDLKVNGSLENSTPYVLNVCLPTRSNASMLLFNLDLEGVAVSGGSACSSGSHKSSRVLTELAIDGSQPAVRFSFSRYNTAEEIDFVLEKIKQIYL
jgi:cysteine desulfurase